MAGRIARTMDASDWALLIALSVLWGGTFFFAEVALAEVRPLTLVFARVGIAAGALVARGVRERAAHAAQHGAVGCVPRHGRAQQPDPVQPDLLGPDPDHGRPRGDP